MNKLLNARWGYTGDGMGCCVVEGMFFAELAVEQDDNSILFVCASHIEEYGRIDIRGRSSFDDFLFYGDSDRDDDTIEFDYFDLKNGWNEEDPMFSVINLALAMIDKAEDLSHEFYGYQPSREYDGAKNFVNEWMFEDLDECDIPTFTNHGYWDDDWDDEEE